MSHPLIEVPFRQDIVSLFPEFTRTGDTCGTVKHDLASTLMLRNLGIEVPSPVSCYYDFPCPPDKPPFDVQKWTVELLTENLRAYVLSSMGVGKTVCPLWAFDWLKKHGLVNRMIVWAPLSTLKFTWLREAFDFLPHLTCSVVHARTRQKRLDALEAPADIYIINHDGWQSVGEELLKRPDIDVCCIDELAAYRNASDRSKWMQKYANHPARKFVWGMTGAPTPHAPTDVFQQAKIVTPKTVPKYFGRFRDELMIKISEFKYVPRKEANDKAFAVLQPSVRYTLEDVTELPPYISRRIDVDLGPKQKRVYEDLRKHAQALVDGGDITAVNAGAALNKLMQVSLGWVYNSNGQVVALDNDGRIDALVDLLNAATGKVIVFSAYKHALSGIEGAIAAHCKDRHVRTVSGDTSAGKRAEIFDEFQNGDAVDTLNAHPQCMAHGITLTAADTVIWFGPILSLEIYDQANHRIRRVGQRKKQSYYHIQATPIERKLYDALVSHQNLQSELLEMFRLDS